MEVNIRQKVKEGGIHVKSNSLLFKRSTSGIHKRKKGKITLSFD